MKRIRFITTHDAVNASAEATFTIGEAESMSLQTACANIGTAGSAQIDVKISNDGTNWAPFQWIKALEPTEDVTEANYSKVVGSGFINTSKIYITGDGSSIYILDPVDSFRFMRIALATREEEGGSFSVIVGIKELS